jgi:pimeloyl-ACP methyl ester carboxylesterase
VLAVWGAEDDFLPPHASRAWLRTALAEAGNTDATLAVLPDLGHSLVQEDGGAPQAALATWLAVHVAAPAREGPR